MAFSSARRTRAGLSPIAGLVWYLRDGSLNARYNSETSQLVQFSTHDLPLSGIREIIVPQIADVLRCDPA
jgi:hypothetical protein